MSPATRQSWGCSRCISKIPSSPAEHGWRRSPPKPQKRRRWLTPACKNARKGNAVLLRRSLRTNLMASTESSKAKEIILPEIRFLSPEELESLRANAEELRKSSSKTRGQKLVDFPYSLERLPRHYGRNDCS